MSEHSILAPSAAGIWGRPGGCTAYPRMAALFPETEPDPAAAIGTASHEIGALLVRAAMVGLFNTLSRAQIVGERASNGLVFTDAMFDGAEIYANDVMEAMRENAIFGGGNLLVEERVYMPKIHELSNGTPDAAMYVEATKTIYNWDYKFGYIVNDAYEHWQSINYIAGLCERWGLNSFNGVDDQEITVCMRIIQPRAFHKDGPVREWVVNLSELRPYFNQLHNAAAVAMSDKATCASGSHCHYCEARHACEAALRGGWQLYEAASAPVPVDLSPRSLGFQLQLIERAREQLECLETGYKERIKSLTMAGEVVPGWTTEPTFYREAWTKPAATVIRIGELLKKDFKKPKDVITPNQARKLGVDPAVIDAHTELPRKGFKTVPVDGTLARKVFTND